MLTDNNDDSFFGTVFEKVLKMNCFEIHVVTECFHSFHQAGNCRVMAHCPPLATIVVSQPSSSPLFPGFGVKKVWENISYIGGHPWLL